MATVKGEAPFALQILKEMGEPVVTMTQAELDAKVAAGAAGEEGNAGAAPGATGAGEGAAAGTPATATTKTGDEGTAATAGEEAVKTDTGGEKPAPKVIELPGAEAGKGTPPVKAEVEVDDEAILAAINKRHGLNLKSIDELKAIQKKEPTEDEKKAAQDEIREQAIQYGLKSKKFNSEDLAAYNLAKAGDQRELALEAFSAEMLKRDPELTTDEIEERFSTYFGEALADDHWLKAVRQQEMQNLAQMHLNSKYGAITNIANEYSENLHVEGFARKYKDEVENVVSSYPEELKFKVGDKEYGFKPTADARSAIKEQFLTESQMLSFGGEAPDPATLQLAFDTAVKTRDINRIVASVAKAYAAEMLADHHAGRKGALPAVEIGASEHSTQPAYNGRAMEVVERVNS